ncbi:MAG: hypothetical protein WBC22_00175 [Sedimentisphaerales bacterium]
MNTFIENNRPWLKLYCTTARIVGWGILILAGAGAIFQILAMNILFGDHTIPYRLSVVKSVLFDGVLTGILVLGIAQFIRYLFESGYKPGYILRNGDKILYLYASLLIAGGVWRHLIIGMMSIGITRMLLPRLASMVLTVPKVLILVGLAQVVKRILPVIGESKTLV